MSAPRVRGRTRPQRISIVVEDDMWRSAGVALIADMKRAVRHCLSHAATSSASQLTILLTSDTRVQALNSQHRGKHKPTNVLSFPSTLPDYLGDVAIAYGVTAAEGSAAAKPLAHHALHLTVHGVLHLLGYDHIKSRDADRMEALETEILAEMGIPDPYRRDAA